MNVFGITGWKNSGKTGLVERLVTHFSEQGLRVSTVKHAHHAFDVDSPGRDSFRHRAAGAHEVLISSRQRMALMRELRGTPEPTLDELLAQLSPVDLVLVEGNLQTAACKIEVWRAAVTEMPIATHDSSISAVVTDDSLDLAIPVWSRSDLDALANELLDRCSEK